MSSYSLPNFIDVTVVRVVVSVLMTELLLLGSLRSQQNEDPSPYSEAELIPEVLTIQPGVPFTVALRIELDSGWHSYWWNPGDAGQPASIDWEIPAGFRVGDIQWPFPEIVEDSTVTSYGYEEEVTLLVEVVPPRFMSSGYPVRFDAEARWLVCANICLPAQAEVGFEVTVLDSPPTVDGEVESVFAKARNSLPATLDHLEFVASQDSETVTLNVGFLEQPSPSLAGAYFYVSERGVLEHGEPQTFIERGGEGSVVLRKSRYLRNPLGNLRGVLVLFGAFDFGTVKTRAIAVNAEVGSSGR